jgi:hypothetical protein
LLADLLDLAVEPNQILVATATLGAELFWDRLPRRTLNGPNVAQIYEASRHQHAAQQDAVVEAVDAAHFCADQGLQCREPRSRACGSDGLARGVFTGSDRDAPRKGRWPCLQYPASKIVFPQLICRALCALFLDSFCRAQGFVINSEGEDLSARIIADRIEEEAVDEVFAKLCI